MDATETDVIVGCLDDVLASLEQITTTLWKSVDATTMSYMRDSLLLQQGKLLAIKANLKFF